MKSSDSYVPFWKSLDPVVLNRRDEDRDAVEEYERERADRLAEFAPAPSWELELRSVREGWFRAR